MFSRKSNLPAGAIPTDTVTANIERKAEFEKGTTYRPDGSMFVGVRIDMSEVRSFHSTAQHGGSFERSTQALAAVAGGIPAIAPPRTQLDSRGLMELAKEHLDVPLPVFRQK